MCIQIYVCVYIRYTHTHTYTQRHTHCPSFSPWQVEATAGANKIGMTRKLSIRYLWFRTHCYALSHGSQFDNNATFLQMTSVSLAFIRNNFLLLLLFQRNFTMNCLHDFTIISLGLSTPVVAVSVYFSSLLIFHHTISDNLLPTATQELKIREKEKETEGRKTRNPYYLKSSFLAHVKYSHPF